MEGGPSFVAHSFRDHAGAMWLDYARASSVLGASMSGQAASNVSPIALYVPAKVTNKHTAVLVVRVAAGVKQGSW